MKTLKLLTLLAISTSPAFADFTIIKSEDETYRTISGTGSSALLTDFDTTSTSEKIYSTGLLLSGASIDFNEEKINYRVSGKSTAVGLTNYGIFSQGDNSITISGKSRFVISNSIISKSGNLSITVNKVMDGEKVYNNVLVTPKFGVENSTLTLNLNQEGAISTTSDSSKPRNTKAFVLYIGSKSTVNLNMSADQFIQLDYRAGADSDAFNLNVTDGAKLFVESVANLNAGSKIVTTLSNGAMLFYADHITDYTKISEGIITTHKGDLAFVDSKGANLTNLQVETITIDERNYVMITAVAVPEPAEWAAIFGAIALAFAIYRRRK